MTENQRRARLRRARTRLDAADAEFKAEIIDATNAGMTRRQIADEVGFSYSRVQQIVRDHRRASSTGA